MGASRAASQDWPRSSSVLRRLHLHRVHARQIERAAQAESLANSYEDGIEVFQTQERLKLQFFLDPSAQSAIRLEQAGLSCRGRRRYRGKGDQEDAELARDSSLSTTTFRGTERLLGAMAAGDPEQRGRSTRTSRSRIRRDADRLTAAAPKARGRGSGSSRGARDEVAVRDRRAHRSSSRSVRAALALWRILSQNERATQRTYREIEQLSRLRCGVRSTAVPSSERR